MIRPPGRPAGQSKYTALQVQRVRRLWQSGLDGRPLTGTEIAKITRLPQSTVFDMTVGITQKKP